MPTMNFSKSHSCLNKSWRLVITNLLLPLTLKSFINPKNKSLSKCVKNSSANWTKQRKLLLLQTLTEIEPEPNLISSWPNIRRLLLSSTKTILLQISIFLRRLFMITFMTTVPKQKKALHQIIKQPRVSLIINSLLLFKRKDQNQKMKMFRWRNRIKTLKRKK